MKNVLEYLEQSAEHYPENIAAEDEYGECTYYELWENSRRIGCVLACIIEQRMPVAVFMDKGIQALCAFFGTVYAGGFYSLLNPHLPEERLRQIQSVLNDSIIITDRKNFDNAIKIFEKDRVYLIDDLKTNFLDSDLLSVIRGKMVDTDPLYANFTSGSTGVPKGVLVNHRSVIDFIDNFTDLFAITKIDVIGNQAPFDFDVSVKDIYSSIKAGAKLTIIPMRLFSNPVGLLDFICEHRITTMIWAVSALCLISTFHGLDYRVPDTVNKVLFSGEVMPLKHLNSWLEHLPDCKFVNLYGPTEITCNCTYHIIDRNRNYENGIPIGKAFSNKDVFLLDSDNKEIITDERSGEICVRGTALALGYYNSPEQTAKAFVQNPLNTYYPELIYRTGDYGKYDKYGDIYFCGRKDFQIKHMGHRIELEEIEKAINNTPGIDRCCCIFDERKSKLYGFYLGDIDKKELRQNLKKHLPIFMIPNALRKLDDMPITPNGKIDRKALRNIMEGMPNE